MADQQANNAGQASEQSEKNKYAEVLALAKMKKAARGDLDTGLSARSGPPPASWPPPAGE